eukprot:6182082-Pleurochrysis_carterae.AAC.2
MKVERRGYRRAAGPTSHWIHSSSAGGGSGAEAGSGHERTHREMHSAAAPAMRGEFGAMDVATRTATG